ncbi:hybrid sensor histidine kinase/response regulator transcription factor [uncultured Maribacter sp.]|uniref:hybrid sensor histidine kinase/response regulator transcription factor n=1 Tax=uncultured Maribacter sp. TaxID=431308 RepID=UPI002601B946|nr:hybrid sensor histidine kinase/response regulator transcription factor [uncultured Maribacter sp.]
MSSKIPFLWFYTICLLLVFKTNGQTSNDTYSFVTIDEGIPKSAITKIIQDKDGLIWIATYGEGLFKYNGTDLKMYKHNAHDSNTINNSLVNTVFIDSNNNIWVGSNEGLNKYNQELDIFQSITISKNELTHKDLPVFAISEDTSGSLFIGTPAQGLYKLNVTDNSIDEIKDAVGSKGTKSIINTIVPLKGDDMLIGSTAGLFKYKKNYNTLETIDLKTESGNILKDYAIQSITIDDNENIWIGTFTKGLLRIKKEHSDSNIVDVFNFTDKRIFAIKVLANKTIICGTENDGLFVLDRNGNPLYNYTYDKSDPKRIRSNSIWSLFVDNQDRIWLGYYNKGISVYDKFYDKFSDLQSLPYSENSLQSPSVTGIVQDSDDQLWIGMDGGGIDKYNLETKEFDHLYDNFISNSNKLKNLDVQTIFLDKHENLWVGTWSSGIFYLPKSGKSFKNFSIETTDQALTSNSIISFSEDSKGIIYIGTYFGGLHSYNPVTKEFHHHSSEHLTNLLGKEGHIRTVLVDHKDNIWIGGPDGLVKANWSNDSKLETEILNEIISKNSDIQETINVRSLFEDSTHHIWVGTYGKGLCQINTKTNDAKWFNSDDGLLLDNISSIIEDDNKNIWVSGETGLAMLNTKTKQFSNYNKEDGLLANNFNYNAVTKDKNGILYFGNYEGVDYFNPNNILKNTHKPPVYLTDFKLFNKSVIPSEEGAPIHKNISEVDNLTLKPDQFVFTLEFAAVNFTRANNNQYAYYLEGFEDDWNYVGNSRFATYTNLSPGDYTFHVKASNNDGMWTANPLSLPITVLAPWWATNWAILGYLLLFIGLVIITNWYLNKRREERRIIQLERSQRQQEEILNEKKIQFFTNISHEFRTPLTLIMNPIMDIMDTNNYKLNKGLKEKHRIIYRNANRLKNLIDELMDFRKLHLHKLTLNTSRINAYTFVKEITKHFEEEAFEKNIILSTETDDNTEMDFWGDPGLLEKVIFNLLSNSFKATPENGVITLGVYAHNKKIMFPLIDDSTPRNAIEINIEDTGSGISKDDIEHIFKRFYQASDKTQQYFGSSGTGIGLELVQSFVQLHKGIVEVDSEIGEGTKFTLLFPLGKDHLESSELSIPTGKETKDVTEEQIDEEISTNQIFDLETENKKTILIVEDNAELRNYLKNKLRADYKVVEAENGKVGLQFALKGIPDLIITDVIMPEMDGFEFCKHIKEDLKTSHIPVIMLTAKAMSSDKIKGIDSGADTYLNKPFEMKLLKSYINRLIKSRQQFLEKNINDKNKITLLDNTTSLDKTFMQKVLDYVNENLGEPDLNVEHLADDMSLSRSQLYRKIKAITGMTANELIRKIRLKKAKQMIESGSESISEVGFKVGFSSASYFSKCFKNEFGILPTELKTNS